MISLKDRHTLTRNITTAHSAGARLKSACKIVGIDQCSVHRLKVITNNGLMPTPCCSFNAQPCVE